MIRRMIEEKIDKYIEDRDNTNILFIWGPRRSGKTTILEYYGKKMDLPVFNFDISTDREKFKNDVDWLKKIVGDLKVILIDEVQNYPESTKILKIIHDVLKIKIIATGSSELRKKAGKDFDTLAGRFEEYYCLPLSLGETKENDNPKEINIQEWSREQLAKTLSFGWYPEVMETTGETEKVKKLENLVEAYVLKDIVNFYDLQSAELAKKVLMMVALQLGQEVSYREIASSLQSSPATIANYLDIFCRNYILVELPSFKLNTRKSVSEARKIYFMDLGIRNALVSDFRELDKRPDLGGLFENWVVVEVEKVRRNCDKLWKQYFYREYGGREVDLVVESYKKEYFSWEIKWIEKKAADIFPLEHRFEMINSRNAVEKILEL
ncbi:ATP-binding protein [Candidatus Shapirobacteria bacterium]|nr:ATP-binding protein [Candidatus Shapirobacteria bacterium]